jgi:hypothetical protein
MAQISRPQNATISTHIKLACQNAQCAPFQNIIAIISPDRTLISGHPSIAANTGRGQGHRARGLVT